MKFLPINKFDTKEGKRPTHEICGTVFCSIMFYIMHIVAIICMYSGKESLYIVAMFAYIPVLYFFLGGTLGVACFKYYSPYMMVTYKYNILIFAFQLMSLLNHTYINNAQFNILDKQKCANILVVEGIFIIISIIVYFKEYSVLKSIDRNSIKDNELKKQYYINCTVVEKESIDKAMKIYEKDFVKLVIINMFILSGLLEIGLWLITILYTVMFYSYIFYKYRFCFEITFKRKSILINFICNFVAIVGQIMVIFVKSDLLKMHIFNKIGIFEIIALSYIPFLFFYFKLNGLYRRTKSE